MHLTGNTILTTGGTSVGGEIASDCLFAMTGPLSCGILSNRKRSPKDRSEPKFARMATAPGSNRLTRGLKDYCSMPG